jgi:outer membrane biosynthesis protein TonB
MKKVTVAIALGILAAGVLANTTYVSAANASSDYRQAPAVQQNVENQRNGQCAAPAPTNDQNRVRPVQNQKQAPNQDQKQAPNQDQKQVLKQGQKQDQKQVKNQDPKQVERQDQKQGNRDSVNNNRKPGQVEQNKQVNQSERNGRQVNQNQVPPRANDNKSDAPVK